MLSLAERAFRRAGLRVRAEVDPARMELGPGEAGVCLTDGGEGFSLADESGALDDAQQQLLAAWTALEAGQDALLLPVQATRAIQPLAARCGAGEGHRPTHPV